MFKSVIDTVDCMIEGDLDGTLRNAVKSVTPRTVEKLIKEEEITKEDILEDSVGFLLASWLIK